MDIWMWFWGRGGGRGEGSFKGWGEEGEKIPSECENMENLFHHRKSALRTKVYMQNGPSNFLIHISTLLYASQNQKKRKKKGRRFAPSKNPSRVSSEKDAPILPRISHAGRPGRLVAPSPSQMLLGWLLIDKGETNRFRGGGV